ncbi:hypothetical protein [Mycolicibacterium austroafricanum]|uniref:hypothetical protein n=1 Tax=Mycolicibacterium austroafricanum TaxID=39687 RepID=UPI001F32144E|nr:hypothetical protein [Mycolicibacterium austroafricanum]
MTTALGPAIRRHGPNGYDPATRRGDARARIWAHLAENAEQRLVEAKDRAWLGEVAALEDGIKHLRTSQAQQLLWSGSNPFAEQGPQ